MPEVPPVITATLFSSFFMMRVFEIRTNGWSCGGNQGYCVSLVGKAPLNAQRAAPTAKRSSSLENRMKSDQRSVNAAWRRAVEAWLSDQALIEVH
jgi:hypothetical protein